MECLSFRNKDKTELSRAVSNISYDKLNCRVLRSDVLEMKSNILEVCCVLPERQGMLEAQNGLFSRRRRPRHGDGWIWEQYLVYGYSKMYMGLILYILLPSQFISLLCNLVYPILAFFKVGLDAHYVQIILSSIYFLLLGIALLCFPAMYCYRRLMLAIPVQAIALKAHKALDTRLRNKYQHDNSGISCVFKNIEKEYAMELNQVYVEQIVLHFFQELGPLMMKIIGPQRHPKLDRNMYFLRNLFQYRDQHRKTLREVKEYHNKPKLYSFDCEEHIPLLSSWNGNRVEYR